MKIIYTHPCNLPLLESWANENGIDGTLIPVRTNPHMERSKPSGRIVAPDGSTAPRKGWTWQWDRFTVLEESDLPWALSLGLVWEETEPLFYVVDDFLLRDMWRPMLLRPPRFLVSNISS